MSFDDQIDYFENTTKVIKAKIGEQAANNLLKDAIYFIGMGKMRKKCMNFSRTYLISESSQVYVS